MKEAGEHEKVLFLSAPAGDGQEESLAKGRPGEAKHDFSKNCEKRLKVRDETKLIFLTACDHLFVVTVVLVNVVGFWRGLFGIFSQFQDLYHLFFLYLMGSSNNICSSILRKVYTYVFGCASVAQWAGLWYFLDAMTGFDAYPPFTYSVVCSGILIWIKLYRNVLASPLTFCTDRVENFFEFPTAFDTALSKQGTSDTSLFVLDCFFSVFVIGSLVVFVWRGVWCLTDVFLFPENEKYSAFGSLVIGYGIVIAVFGVQIPVGNLCGKLTGFWRLLVADVYVFVAFIGTINLWRGIWNLLNIYFLPESPIWSCWITHLGSFAFLILINCSNSTLVRGVYLDGEEGSKCVAFPVSYLRLIFKKHSTKNVVKSETNRKTRSLTNGCGDVEKAQKENAEVEKGFAKASEATS